jgi:PAS domain S-box-containing protein
MSDSEGSIVSQTGKPAGFLDGGGEMGALMRAKDWAATPLGRPEQWSPSIKTAISICLNSYFPILLWLGPELRLVYNDAYIPFLGNAKHPGMLGEPGRAAWGEIWETIGPMHQRVQAGSATWVEHRQMFFSRQLPREEVYVTFGYSPILGPDLHSIDGVFCACYETTKEVIRERRLTTLGEFGARSLAKQSVDEAARNALDILARNPLDIAFAAIYLVDGDQTARLSGVINPSRDAQIFPALHDLNDSGPWPFGRVIETNDVVELADLQNQVGRLHSSIWQEPLQTGLLFPLNVVAEPHFVGVLIVGVSPRLVLDADYRTFFSLVAGHISTTISDARAFVVERRRADELAEIDRAKTVFFSNISHEFRTPLTLMLGPLEVMLAKAPGKLDEQTRSLATTAHHNCLRLLRLVNTLLSFSRTEAGRTRAKYGPADLAGLTAQLASSFAFACEQAGLQLDIDCTPLPEPVFVDPNMWEMIVFNLISNALKYTFTGGIGVEIRTAGGKAELRIVDSGVGIPEKDLPLILERFHRVEGQRSPFIEGSGIGLAVVAELTKLHGGSIAVESTEGQGTTFTIAVPFGTSHLPAERVSNTELNSSRPDWAATAFVAEAERWLNPNRGTGTSSTGDRPEAAQNARSARIIVADDNEDMRSYLTTLLSTQWEVEAVADGLEALAAARRVRPDLVLADVMMPLMNGHELVSALRADADLRSVPIIVLSARAGEGAVIEGLESGADDYLVKPFAAVELIARVKTHLILSRQRNEEIMVLNTLRRLSDRLIASSDLSVTLHELLDAVMEILSADFGDIQLLDQNSGTLSIEAHRNLPPEFLSYFRTVDASDTSACGIALREKRQVIIEDIESCADYAPHRQIAARTGFRAVISIPLCERGSGNPVGMLSAMFRQPFRRASSRALQIVGLYADQASDVIGIRLSEQRLRESEERFREFGNHSRDVLWILEEATSRLVYLSPAFSRVWGRVLTRSPMLVDLLAGIFSEDRKQVDDTLRGVRAGENIVEEHRIERPDGSVRWIHHTIFPIRSADGQIRRLGGIAQDVTRDDSSFVYLVNDADTTAPASQLRDAGYSVKTFASPRAFQKVAPALIPGCVVIDISRSGANQLGVLHDLKARRSIHPIIVAGNCHGDVGLAVAAMKAGAVDWLEVPYRPEALRASVAAALADLAANNEHDWKAGTARRRISALPSREKEVLDGLVAGRTNKEIAREMGISPRTVEIHRSHLMHRLGVETLPEAIMLAAAAGLRP